MAKGRDLAGIKLDARRQAMRFYGPLAELEIIHVGPVHASVTGPRFIATVELRCANFASLTGDPR
jgi:hypothetical protein